MANETELPIRNKESHNEHFNVHIPQNPQVFFPLIIH
jgi:hypothetical protein